VCRALCGLRRPWQALGPTAGGRAGSAAGAAGLSPRLEVAGRSDACQSCLAGPAAGAAAVVEPGELVALGTLADPVWTGAVCALSGSLGRAAGTDGPFD